MKEGVSVQDRAKAPPNKRARAASGAPATDGRSRSLWFDAPIDDPDRKLSTSVRQVDQGFVVSSGSSLGWLIQAKVGSFGGAGGLVTNRSGWAA
jgi:hypothetical protein